MCGIGGVMMFGAGRLNNVAVEFAKYATDVLLVENQVRGAHASGCAIFNKDGSYVCKNPLPANKFIASRDYAEFQQEVITKDTRVILVHTRYATQGKVTNNHNNHPIVADHVIGVHNGMIHNDDDLFKNHKLDRKAQVDSEVIFRMMDKFGGNKRLRLEGVKYVAEQLEGMFTTAFVNIHQTNVMYLVRKDNPVTLAIIKELGLILFASQSEYIKAAIDYACDMLFNSQYTFTVEYVTPKANTIYRFDTKQDIAEQFEQEPTKFDAKEHVYSSRRGWWDEWTDDEWEMYMGGRYGRGRTSTR